MAETEERSLDNFFAKRDKKKKKERSNRAASAASAAGAAGGSSVAAGAAGSGAGAGARPADGGTAGAAGLGAATKAVTKDEDEWKEFEQKEVDYSGLRVQAMQISEKEEDDSEKREDPGDNWEEGGGGGGGVEKSSGPWNKTAPVQAAPAPVTVTETPEPAMTSGVYRPPGARLTTTRKAPQGPPEIYSDTQFPSLQSTAKHVESRNRHLK
ncbi:protein CDV3 homolog isoform X3 [Desmodus rotundus]|uniref:protein CDV3 homolog isoform X3 n=1 Tax=Desmodus rotundus TaxID=9430 RepID=UPI0023811565|nr:protein CDV3 homolog isoform X3 [Desmodus rotundus]